MYVHFFFSVEIQMFYWSNSCMLINKTCTYFTPCWLLVLCRCLRVNVHFRFYKHACTFEKTQSSWCFLWFTEKKCRTKSSKNFWASFQIGLLSTAVFQCSVVWKSYIAGHLAWIHQSRTISHSGGEPRPDGDAVRR